MNAKVYSAYDLQSRFKKAACKMDCENIQKAKQGKAIDSVDDSVFEILFIAELLPYLNASQLRQKECYLNDKYGI